MDEIGLEHDRLRGAEHNYEKLLGVAELIRDLKKTYDHIVLGVHTVISKHNVHRIPEIARQARATFQPDSYITEVAENRVELKTIDKDITPDSGGLPTGGRDAQGYIRANRVDAPVARLSSLFASSTTISPRRSSKRSAR